MQTQIYADPTRKPLNRMIFIPQNNLCGNDIGNLSMTVSNSSSVTVIDDLSTQYRHMQPFNHQLQLEESPCIMDMCLGDKEGRSLYVVGNSNARKTACLSHIDIRSNQIIQHFEYAGRNPFTSIASTTTTPNNNNTNDMLLFTGSELAKSRVELAMWDKRNLSIPLAEICDSIGDDITKLYFNPANRFVYCSSMDGLVSVYNVLNMSSVSAPIALFDSMNQGGGCLDEYDSLQMTYNSLNGSSILDFCLVSSSNNGSDGSIVMVSHDNQLAICDAETGELQVPLHHIPTDFGIDSIVNIIPNTTCGDSYQQYQQQQTVVDIACCMHSGELVIISATKSDSLWNLSISERFTSSGHSDSIRQCFRLSNGQLVSIGDDGLMILNRSNGGNEDTFMGTTTGIARSRDHLKPSSSSSHRMKPY